MYIFKGRFLKISFHYIFFMYILKVLQMGLLKYNLTFIIIIIVVVWLVGWLADWLIGWLIDWLIDW